MKRSRFAAMGLVVLVAFAPAVAVAAPLPALSAPVVASPPLGVAATVSVEPSVGVSEDSYVPAGQVHDGDLVSTSWIESMGSARFQEFTVHWPFQDGLRAADIFLATDAFQRTALSRRRRVELDEGFHTFVISPEDLLLYKLVAYRNKDRAAIERLLAIQPAMDWSHVREWAARLGVTARLEEALRDAGLDAMPD